MCVYVCAYVCVRMCVRACAYVCVCIYNKKYSCVCAYVRARVCALIDKENEKKLLLFLTLVSNASYNIGATTNYYEIKASYS